MWGDWEVRKLIVLFALIVMAGLGMVNAPAGQAGEPILDDPTGGTLADLVNPVTQGLLKLSLLGS
jgi:hypothetical protein